MGVKLIYQGSGKIAPGRAGLVGDYHHLDPRGIEAEDGREGLGQQDEAAGMVDIAHLFVDGAVPVQEDRGLTHERSFSQIRAAAATSSTLMASRQAEPVSQVRLKQGLHGWGWRITVAREVKGPVATGVGGAEQGHQGDRERRGGVHQPRVVGDQKVELGHYPQGLPEAGPAHQIRHRPLKLCLDQLCHRPFVVPPSSTRRAPNSRCRDCPRAAKRAGSQRLAGP